jgi:hypothetical protein
MPKVPTKQSTDVQVARAMRRALARDLVEDVIPTAYQALSLMVHQTVTNCGTNPDPWSQGNSLMASSSLSKWAA